MESINGDLSVRVCVDTTALDWTPSPSGTVWRKRVHLVGPPESGQVTSVVRYEPGARFPGHPHPQGEEIFVLDGVFSDEHGDWPAGTYLLNPEGFRHAPFSVEGCLLLVKLRQFPGRDRIHVAIPTDELEWSPTETPGIAVKALYDQPGFTDATQLERFDPGAAAPLRDYPGGAEIFVLDGSMEDEQGRYGAGTWMRLPAGSEHRPRSTDGCRLFVKTGGLAYLNSA
jgi:anti-sigma factor ChrR (cupin superfamily)